MKKLLNIKESPYVLLLITAIVLLFAFVFPPFAHIDFRDKTMFSLPMASVVWMIPVHLICIWLFDLLTKRLIYSITFTWIHVLITVSAAILILPVLYIATNPSQPAIDSHVLIGNTMQLLIIALICGVFTCIANVLAGLVGTYKYNRQAPF